MSTTQTPLIKLKLQACEESKKDKTWYGLTVPVELLASVKIQLETKLKKEGDVLYKYEKDAKLHLTLAYWGLVDEKKWNAIDQLVTSENLSTDDLVHLGEPEFVQPPLAPNNTRSDPAAFWVAPVKADRLLRLKCRIKEEFKIVNPNEKPDEVIPLHITLAYVKRRVNVPYGFGCHRVKMPPSKQIMTF